MRLPCLTPPKKLAAAFALLALCLTALALWQRRDCNPVDGAKMVWVPGGEFLMDADKHRVNLPGFWIYKTEVTVAQYQKFCDATGHKMPPAPPWGWHDDIRFVTPFLARLGYAVKAPWSSNRPIVNVSWFDAKAYANWAGVSLPTDAQWEKAARGTDGRKYPWGNQLDQAKAVCKSSQPAPVGSISADTSPYGCLDMAGNVWEWCEDNSNAEDEDRVLRGGSWNYDYPFIFRTSSRGTAAPGLIYDTFGFRCSQGQ